MFVAVVIPCLNERDTIPVTARSLGFGVGRTQTPHDVYLVLVDNGSSDGTQSVLHEIKAASRRGSVRVVSEKTRGYIPPRHRGIEEIKKYASRHQLPVDDILILQADADTTYENNFVAIMADAAVRGSRNVLLEGVTHPPDRFVEDHPGYQRLADQTDADVAAMLAADDIDVMVDDKVSGFRLADYINWGGHQRIYNAKGAEIHAETARLYIHAKMQGAKRVRVAEASAIPSRRKIVRNPVRHFATGGFPREESWWRSWSAAYTGPRDMEAFERAAAKSVLSAAITTRKAHLLAMLGALPVAIDRFLQPRTVPKPCHPLIEKFLQDMDISSARQSEEPLAPFFQAALLTCDEWSTRPDL